MIFFFTSNTHAYNITLNYTYKFWSKLFTMNLWNMIDGAENKKIDIWIIYVTTHSTP
jgi:hypothetical protein